MLFRLCQNKVTCKILLRKCNIYLSFNTRFGNDWKLKEFFVNYILKLNINRTVELSNLHKIPKRIRI